MVSTLTWVVLGVGFYWIAVGMLSRAGYLPEYVGTQGPITTLHTQRGKEFLDWLSRYRRFWRAWANFGVGVALVVMIGAFAFLLFSAIAALQVPQSTPVNQPRNVLVIPGVNDFLPLAVAPEIVFGLLVGLVVHEGGHGLLCRVEDIDIDSMGLALFTIIPIGAFVEPDEESRREADRGAQTRMFAAGVTNNFAVTVIVFALLYGPVIAAIGVAPGAAVGGALPNSSADRADIGHGDRITAIDGQSVANNDELSEVLEGIDDRTVEVTVNGDRTRTVERSLLVTGSVEGGPADLPIGNTITSVNGTEIHVESAFRDALREREVVTVETAEGESATFPAGAFVQTTPGGPLADAGAPTDGPLVIVAVDGDRVISADELGEWLEETEPGEEVEVAAYADGERENYTVTLGDNPRNDNGFLGIRSVPGITGLSVSDFGIRPYPAETYLTLLGKEGGGAGGFSGLLDSFFGKIFVALLLPVGSFSGLPFNFAGFTGGITEFYTVTGPLSVLGDGTFLLANLLFWTGWINVQLGFFNCIPAFPLDGGHILRTSTEAVFSRLPGGTSREQIQMVTITVGLAMLVSFLALVFGPGLLA